MKYYRFFNLRKSIDLILKHLIFQGFQTFGEGSYGKV